MKNKKPMFVMSIAMMTVSYAQNSFAREYVVRPRAVDSSTFEAQAEKMSEEEKTAIQNSIPHANTLDQGNPTI